MEFLFIVQSCMYCVCAFLIPKQFLCKIVATWISLLLSFSGAWVDPFSLLLFSLFRSPFFSNIPLKNAFFYLCSISTRTSKENAGMHNVRKRIWSLWKCKWTELAGSDQKDFLSFSFVLFSCEYAIVLPFRWLLFYFHFSVLAYKSNIITSIIFTSLDSDEALMIQLN